MVLPAKSTAFVSLPKDLFQSRMAVSLFKSINCCLLFPIFVYTERCQLPPVMKSIQQKHVTDHRATYCYKPQRAILIIALQKISRFVFNGVPSKRFSFIELHFYYTINMAIFQVLLVKKAPCFLLCFSHTYILLLQKTAFFRLAPFYQPQKSVPPERSRKYNFKLKICFFLLDRVSFLVRHPKIQNKHPIFRAKYLIPCF